MTQNKENEITSPIFDNEWMIRPCEFYREEYSDCTSIKARFNQYFIYGSYQDCSQWKRDYNNCIKWNEVKDVKAATELIDSEKARRKARLSAHYSNDIWERRKSPPEDWNKPLPENMAKDYENSYLGIKAREMRGEKVEHNFKEESFCTIM